MKVFTSRNFRTFGCIGKYEALSNALSSVSDKLNAMKRIRNIHPGEVLMEEFLKPMGVSAYRLSKDTGIPQTRISAIVKGNRAITADTALRLSKYFGVSAKFWLGLQDDFDIEEQTRQLKDTLKSIPRFEGNAA